MSNNNKTPTKLKAVRLELGLTHKDLYEKTQIKQSALSKVEIEQERNIRIVLSLCLFYLREYQINPMWILTEGKHSKTLTDKQQITIINHILGAVLDLINKK